MRKQIFFILIIVLALFLRQFNYVSYPRHGATFDEFAWVWLGINLIQKGEPISWSPHPHYKDRKHLIYQGAAFWIVEPYVEHPPLFGLVAGGFAIVNGVHDMYHVTLDKIRPLSLFLGVLSIGMIYLLVLSVYGNGAALLGAILYATVPTVVIGSRIVQNENFLIPFWLLSLWLIFKYLKTAKHYFRNSAAVIAGALSLAKVPWLVVAVSLALILSYYKKWRDAFIVLGIALLFFSIFFLYGFYFDRELFLSLWRLQVARYDISFDGFFSVFTNPLLVDRFYLDGWVLFGWFSIASFLKDFKKHVFLVLPFIAYLTLYIFGIPNEPSHGWYRYPFLPFLLTSAALAIKEEYNKTSLLSVLFIFVVGLALFQNTWAELFGFSYAVYRIFILASCASILIPLWFEKYKKYQKPILLSWLIFFVLLNILSVIIYRE